MKFKSLHDARKKRIRTNKDESKSLHKPEIVDQVEVHEEKDFDRKMKEQILEVRGNHSSTLFFVEVIFCVTEITPRKVYHVGEGR